MMASKTKFKYKSRKLQFGNKSQFKIHKHQEFPCAPNVEIGPNLSLLTEKSSHTILVHLPKSKSSSHTSEPHFGKP